VQRGAGQELSATKRAVVPRGGRLIPRKDRRVTAQALAEHGVTKVDHFVGVGAPNDDVILVTVHAASLASSPRGRV
jgi:hypothetical protein